MPNSSNIKIKIIYHKIKIVLKFNVFFGIIDFYFPFINNFLFQPRISVKSIKINRKNRHNFFN